MSINNIRTKFTTLGEAIQYSTVKGWSNSLTEKNIEDELEWVDIYKYLCLIRDRSNAYTEGDKNVDYLYTLSTLHTQLIETVQALHTMYLEYYTKEPALPTLPNGEIDHKIFHEYLTIYKSGCDTLLFRTGSLYNRIKIVRKILIDKGYDAPSLPKETLRMIRQVITGYPQDFIDLE